MTVVPFTRFSGPGSLSLSHFGGSYNGAFFASDLNKGVVLNKAVLGHQFDKLPMATFYVKHQGKLT